AAERRRRIDRGGPFERQEDARRRRHRDGEPLGVRALDAGRRAHRRLRHRADRIQARLLISLPEGLSVIAHFASSSIAVAATLWLLVAFSVATWALVIAKA